MTERQFNRYWNAYCRARVANDMKAAEKVERGLKAALKKENKISFTAIKVVNEKPVEEG